MGDDSTGVRSRRATATAAAILLALGATTSAQQPGVQDGNAQSPQIEQDMVFASGENLRLAATTTDDVFAAGNIVLVEGAIADHLFVAGSEVTVSDAAANDLIIAASEIDLRRGTIADDIIIAGSDIVIGPAFRIGDSAVLAAGTMHINAPIPGNLRAGGGKVILNSTVSGNARLTADEIEIGPQAVITGDLNYRSENLIMRPGAVVKGDTRILPVSDTSGAEVFGQGAGSFLLMIGVSILLSYFIVVVLLTFAVPGLMQATSDRMRHRPWQSLGIGTLIAVIVPIAGMLLVWSVVAAPVALLLFAMSIAMTPLALAVSAYFTGRSARSLITGKVDGPTGIGARLLWPGLGAIVIFALTLVPFAGLAVWLVAMLFGLGALAGSAMKAFAAVSDNAEDTGWLKRHGDSTETVSARPPIPQ